MKVKWRYFYIKNIKYARFNAMIYTTAALLSRWSPRATAVNALLKRTIAAGKGGREHENFIKNANKRAAAVHEHRVGDSVLNELVDCDRVGISSGAEKCGCEDVVAVGHLTTTSHVAHDTPHIVRTRPADRGGRAVWLHAHRGQSCGKFERVLVHAEILLFGFVNVL
jgi:hypothetical protein